MLIWHRVPCLVVGPRIACQPILLVRTTSVCRNILFLENSRGGHWCCAIPPCSLPLNHLNRVLAEGCGSPFWFVLTCAILVTQSYLRRDKVGNVLILEHPPGTGFSYVEKALPYRHFVVCSRTTTKGGAPHQYSAVASSKSSPPMLTCTQIHWRRHRLLFKVLPRR